jgi:hypothetical protein
VCFAFLSYMVMHDHCISTDDLPAVLVPVLSAVNAPSTKVVASKTSTFGEFKACTATLIAALHLLHILVAWSPASPLCAVVLASGMLPHVEAAKMHALATSPNTARSVVVSMYTYSDYLVLAVVMCVPSTVAAPGTAVNAAASGDVAVVTKPATVAVVTTPTVAKTVTKTTTTTVVTKPTKVAAPAKPTRVAVVAAAPVKTAAVTTVAVAPKQPEAAKAVATKVAVTAPATKAVATNVAVVAPAGTNVAVTKAAGGATQANVVAAGTVATSTTTAAGASQTTGTHWSRGLHLS